MADGAMFERFRIQEHTVDLETGIALISGGEPVAGLRVMIEADQYAVANGHLGAAGLLQRLRGYQRVLSEMDAVAGSGEVVGFNRGIPELHPDVAIILDALKE